MAKIRIATPILSDAGTLTTGNELGTLPVTNLQTLQPTEVWRTNGLSSMFIELDLGSVNAINTVALLYTNASSGATAQVRTADTQGGLTSAPDHDSGSITFWSSPNLDDWERRSFLYDVPSGVSNRWVRIDITDGSNPDGHFQAGRLYVDNAWTPSRNRSLRSSLRWEDASLKGKSVGSRTFFTPRDKWRVLSFSLRFLGKDEMFADALELDRLRGTSKDILVIPDIDDTTNRHAETVNGVMEELTPITDEFKKLYTKRYEVEELL